MNKIKTILSFLTILCFLNCKSNKESLKLSLLETNYEIVVLFNKEYEKIALIEFPLKIRLQNNSSSKKEYASIKYKYHPYEKGIGNPLYIENKGNLKRVKQSKKKEINSHKNKEYIIYTRHRVDTSKFIQNQFKSYIKEMIATNQDTLAIGTIQQFKKSHIGLLNILTEKDSISVNIWKDKDIIVPVEW